MKSRRLECTEKPDISVLAFIVIADAIPVRRHALDWLFTLKVPCKICSRQHFEFFYLLFIYFSGKISFDSLCESLADDSHEMSRLFSKKIKVKLFSTAVMIGALRVK